MTPLVNVTLPVFNEAAQLVGNVRRVAAFLATQPQYRWEIIIADNGSTDRTFELAESVAGETEARFRMPDTRWPPSEPAPGAEVPPSITIRILHWDQPGRGRALQGAWLASEAEVLSYMDIDLSTDLAHLPELISAVLLDRADIAIGSRLATGSRTTRGWKRELLSRGYNRLLRDTLGLRVRDAQCGFKAISRAAARALLRQICDPGFFFDTELLVLAQRHRWRIVEVPVRWVDDPDTRVRLARTIWADLKGVWRMALT